MIDPAADARGAARASLYLAASLYCEGSSSPIKIRNISSTGALVEAPTTPTPGALVQLVRGELIVHALVAWAEDSRCGLKFSGCIDVPKWRAAPVNREQQRVDDLVRLIKAGAVPLPTRAHGTAGKAGETAASGRDLAGDLRRASELLDNLGGTLASDAELVGRHGCVLQNLDIAMQMIAAVEAIIACDGRLEGDVAKLAGLRRSADQALRREPQACVG